MEMARTAHEPAHAAAIRPARKPASPRHGPFQGRETQISSFSFEKRVAAVSFVAQVFGVEPSDRIPRVEVHYDVPASGPVAEELRNEKDPQEAFKNMDLVAWNRGGAIHFNGWKMARGEVRRQSSLVHETAHISLAEQAGLKGQVIRDLLAYHSAAEGIATYAEVARFRASGMEWKRPEGLGDEYRLGIAFFNSLREMVGGAKKAFHLIASNLPRSMQEIADPQLYLRRVAQERGLTQAVA
jgi:hypothetical protein